MADTPFEAGGAGWIPPVKPTAAAVRHAAARTVARLAGSDRDGLVTALQALGLIRYRVDDQAAR